MVDILKLIKGTHLVSSVEFSYDPVGSYYRITICKNGKFANYAFTEGFLLRPDAEFVIKNTIIDLIKQLEKET